MAWRAPGALVLLLAACHRSPFIDGRNPHPVRLTRPPVVGLSAVAQVGRAIFFDSALSASGHVSCASCHDPAHAYGPPTAQLQPRAATPPHGGAVRSVPSLRYLDRVPHFSIGPEASDADAFNLAQQIAQAGGRDHATKRVGTSTDTALVPRGGLFRDGRAATLQDQAMGPMTGVGEMGNRDVEAVAARLRSAPYFTQLRRLFGTGITASPQRLSDEALFALGRFEIEDSSFHPYDSKYDRYLEGHAALSPEEQRGLAAFDDPARGNCAACHLDRPDGDGRPPAFTDDEYEALGPPRNRNIPANRDSLHYDLGLCGPVRIDLAAATEYCGMFRTPSLRNIATRHVFFHNGAFSTLEQVLTFYNQRDIAPDRVYGAGRRFDDVPARFRSNVDTVDPPFTHHSGDRPPMSARDIADIIAFLRTLTDGGPNSY
jgi:cytochrome c peroxidase